MEFVSECTTELVLDKSHEVCGSRRLALCYLTKKKKKIMYAFFIYLNMLD